ncbi:WYL domain-containing protein [Paraclostridium ghonii]
MKSKELALYLGVSERMIRKYLEDLNEAGIELESIPGPTGGYELVGYDYLLDTNITDEEISSLEIITQLSKESLDENCIKSLEILKEKLKIHNKYTNDENNFSNNIVIPSRVKNLKLQNKIEMDIHKTIILNKKIYIQYTKNYDNTSERKIHPYKIISRDGMKYLIGYCESKNSMRLFKLVRINKLDITDEVFEKIDEEKVKEFIKDNSLGIISGEDIYIKLIISPPFSYSVRERIYSKNQVSTENKDGTILFEATLSSKEEIIRWILSMRSCVKIIEPENLKLEIKEELNKMIQNF